MKRNALNQKHLKTPIGWLLASADEKALHRLEFADAGDQAERNKVLDSIEEELNAYFAGTLKKFDTPLRLNGTPFQVRVWEELQRIPYGQTISYAELAKRIGKPTAYRAVANANGANPLSIIVPCHRVIYANGGLGGYNGGLERKPLLLALERS